MSAKQFAYSPLAAGIGEIRSSWGCFLTFGILFVLLGAVCVIGNISATFATVLFFGWILLFSGIFGLVQAFRTHSWQGFLLSLLERTVPGLHRISVDPVSARRGSQPHFDPCFFLRCRRPVSRHWGRNVEVSALGLVGIVGNCFPGAGGHVTGANAGFECLVHRLRDWRGSDLRRSGTDRPCHRHP